MPLRLNTFTEVSLVFMVCLKNSFAALVLVVSKGLSMCCKNSFSSTIEVFFTFDLSLDNFLVLDTIGSWSRIASMLEGSLPHKHRL